MAWLAVITAGLLEVGFATMLKLSNNFTKIWPSIGFLLFASGSFSLLAWSLKTLPIGTAYAVWTGIGAGDCIHHHRSNSLKLLKLQSLSS